MRITESASAAILGVMTKKGLNPKKIFLEIGLFHDNLGLAFTKEKMGKLVQFGGLNVVINNNIDTTDVVIDFGEVNGRKGLIFLGEEHVNHSNRTSDIRNQ